MNTHAAHASSVTSHIVYDLAVIDNVPFGMNAGLSRFFALRLERPAWTTWDPGQFVMLRPQGWALDMPWARPFSICRVSSQELVVFYQVKGRGTSRMAQLKRGDRVDVWGPLGNGFVIEGSTPTLLLAGGIGIAPFVGYVQKHPRPAMLTMIFGHRMPEDCYPVDTLADRIDFENYHETEPGDLDWLLAHLDVRIKAYAERNGLVLACGPDPFLKAVQSMALAHGARAQLSLENTMACGVGACLGCVTKTRPAWPGNAPNPVNSADPADLGSVSHGMPVQTCTHGPVFWADHISLER